ncbi:uncharacterized protein C2orf42-like [Sarcoramphus papa]
MPGTQATSPLLAQDPAHSNPRRGSLKKPAVASSLKRQGSTQLLDEAQVTLSFQDWLASVTERIHQTMHYQFEGKPEPLVFHIPQAFFDALQQRISSGSTKKRLPNSTTAFVRKDALPLGTFSKYTWHITNVLQVKQIFDTPELPLEITRSFVQNRDGTYEPFRCPKVEVESIAEAYGHPDKQPAIRPLELKTFLKVGEWGKPGSQPAGGERPPPSRGAPASAAPELQGPGWGQQPKTHARSLEQDPCVTCRAQGGARATPCPPLSQHLEAVLHCSSPTWDQGGPSKKGPPQEHKGALKPKERSPLPQTPTQGGPEAQRKGPPPQTPTQGGPEA